MNGQQEQEWVELGKKNKTFVIPAFRMHMKCDPPP